MYEEGGLNALDFQTIKHSKLTGLRIASLIMIYPGSGFPISFLNSVVTLNSYWPVIFRAVNYPSSYQIFTNKLWIHGRLLSSIIFPHTHTSFGIMNIYYLVTNLFFLSSGWLKILFLFLICSMLKGTFFHFLSLCL